MDPSIHLSHPFPLTIVPENVTIAITLPLPVGIRDPSQDSRRIFPAHRHSPCRCHCQNYPRENCHRPNPFSLTIVCKYSKTWQKGNFVHGRIIRGGNRYRLNYVRSKCRNVCRHYSSILPEYLWITEKDMREPISAMNSSDLITQRKLQRDPCCAILRNADIFRNAYRLPVCFDG